MRYEDFIQCFEIKTQRANSCQCICPAHNDREASLTISRGKKHPIILKCHAGCKTEDIVQSAGLNMSDLFEEQACTYWKDFLEQDGREVERVYNYVSFLTGAYTYSRIRFKNTKRMCIGRFTGEPENSYFDLKITKSGSIAESFPMSLYGDIKAVKQAIASNERIYICEGEKDVDNLRRLGYVSCTYGSSDSWYSQLAECFKDGILIVLADNDKPGITVANRIKEDTQGIAKECHIVIPMPTKEHGDISDYLEMKGLL